MLFLYPMKLQQGSMLPTTRQPHIPALCCEVPGLVTAQQVAHCAYIVGLQAGLGNCASSASLQASGKLRHSGLRTLLKPTRRYKPIE